MSAYVVTGGTDALVDGLAAHLRLPVRREPGGSITSWIHLVPGGGDETATLLAAAEAAERHLPDGEGAAFIAAVPVWGVIAPPNDMPAELAAGAARSLAQAKVEPWSRRGRRINVIAYGGLDGAVPGARPAGTLAERTPLHRLAGLADLADAIDFLSSSAASYVTGSTLAVDGGWTAYSWFYPARDL